MRKSHYFSEKFDEAANGTLFGRIFYTFLMCEGQVRIESLFSQKLNFTATGLKGVFLCMFNFLIRGSEVKIIPSFCVVAFFFFCFVFRMTWKDLKKSPEAPKRSQTYVNFLRKHMLRNSALLFLANDERRTVVSFVLLTQC